MQSSGGLDRRGGSRRARGADRALRARRRSARRPRAGGAGGGARRGVLRHGRHLLRRVPDRGRPRGGDRGGRSWRAGRWRWRCSTSTPWAPAAARSRGATRAARCAWGRDSAGADPGPACYGRGGEHPTVTDANLLLGRLPADALLAGGLRLDRDAAERAVAASPPRWGSPRRSISPMRARPGLADRPPMLGHAALRGGDRARRRGGDDSARCERSPSSAGSTPAASR